MLIMAIKPGHDGSIAVVDGSARAQSVTPASNPQLHRLLDAFAAQIRIGALCNTSLNLHRRGFSNRMSDLIGYCEDRGIDDMVVGDHWYTKDHSTRGHHADIQ